MRDEISGFKSMSEEKFEWSKRTIMHVPSGCSSATGPRLVV